MNLQQLKYFVRVVDAGNMTRIAESLHVAQLALGMRIRQSDELARGSLPGAHNVPAGQHAAGALKKAPMPEDDSNTRIVMFGRDAAQARALADALSTRPWHNVAYCSGTFEALKAALE